MTKKNINILKQEVIEAIKDDGTYWNNNVNEWAEKAAGDVVVAYVPLIDIFSTSGYGIDTSDRDDLLSDIVDKCIEIALTLVDEHLSNCNLHGIDINDMEPEVQAIKEDIFLKAENIMEKDNSIQGMVVEAVMPCIYNHIRDDLIYHFEHDDALEEYIIDRIDEFEASDEFNDYDEVVALIFDKFLSATKSVVENLVSNLDYQEALSFDGDLGSCYPHEDEIMDEAWDDCDFNLTEIIQNLTAEQE